MIAPLAINSAPGPFVFITNPPQAPVCCSGATRFVAVNTIGRSVVPSSQIRP